MPKNNMVKIGVATAVAAVGAILAITSVFAHTVPSTSAHSVVGSLAKAARAASFPLVANEPALNLFANDQIADAEEAAERAAALAALQQKIAAELAAKKAAAAAADPCIAADQTEDAAENAADKAEDAAEKAAEKAEDAAEKANGTESAAEDAAEKAAEQTEDAAEKAARQATDGPEDATEVKCAPAAASVKTFAAGSSNHHSEGGKHSGGRD